MPRSGARGRDSRVAATSRKNKFASLYVSLREAIAGGRLACGARLPSTRDLARQEGVARGTVVAVFEQLGADGYLTSRVGSGTFVRAPPPPVSRPDAERRGGSRKPSIRAVSRSPFPSEGTLPCPFRANVPAIDLFPRAIWARLEGRCWRETSLRALSDSDPRGHTGLRRALVEYLALSRGVRSRIEQVLIVPGTQAALDLICRAVLQPDDTAWIEDPGYVGARQLLRHWCVDLVPVCVDSEGMRVPTDVPKSQQPRLVFVTPAHQSPLGVTMSLPRRRALLDQARRSGAWIFEDDYDGELRYGARPLSALQSIDFAGHVVYAGTFSKTLAPSLRLGYLVVPERLVDPLTSLLSLTLRFVAPMAQAVLAEFINSGHFGRHMRRLREAYVSRHEMLHGECQRLLSGMIELEPAAAGLDTIAWLPQRCSDTAVSQALMTAGIETRPLSHYRMRHGRPGLVLGAAAFDEATIRAAVGRMAKALESNPRRKFGQTAP